MKRHRCAVAVTNVLVVACITVATTVAIIIATASSVVIILLYFLQIKNILGDEVKEDVKLLSNQLSIVRESISGMLVTIQKLCGKRDSRELDNGASSKFALGRENDPITFADFSTFEVRSSL